MFACNSDGSIEIPLSYFKKLHFYPPALPLGTIVLTNYHHHNINNVDKNDDDVTFENNSVEDLQLFVQYLLIKLKRKFIMKLDSHSVCDYSPNINNVAQFLENGSGSGKINILFINIPIFFFPDIKKDEPLHKRILRVVSNTHKITQLVEEYMSSKYKSSQKK